MILDVKLFYFLNNLTGKYPVFDAFIVFLASYLQYLLIVVFLLFLYFFQDSRTRKIRIFLITTASTIIARFGVTELIRFFYHRPRPFIVYQLHPLIVDNEWSFPSGHSAFFFAMATAIYLYNKKWGIGFFIAAILMNVSRIISGVHYPSDILGGLIIGMAVAYLTFYLIEGRITKV
jgi:undecaprenyl-diphosphatase